MAKLKPCPFCGRRDTPRLMTRHGKDGWRDRYYIICDYDDGGCGSCSGWYKTVGEAVDCWNTRKDDREMKLVDVDLISRKAAVSRISDLIVFELRGERILTWNGVYKALNELPTVAAVPVVHGYWTTKRSLTHDGEWYCSNCEYEPTVFEEYNYCPNCGAKMDEEADDDEA